MSTELLYLFAVAAVVELWAYIEERATRRLVGPSFTRGFPLVRRELPLEARPALVVGSRGHTPVAKYRVYDQNTVLFRRSEAERHEWLSSSLRGSLKVEHGRMVVVGRLPLVDVVGRPLVAAAVVASGLFGWLALAPVLWAIVPLVKDVVFSPEEFEVAAREVVLEIRLLAGRRAAEQ